MSASPEDPVDSPPPAIRLEGVIKRYGSFTALNGLSISIPRGCIFGLFGPNGSGKSSLVRILSGLMEPTQGRAWIDGREVLPGSLELKRATGVLSDDMALVDLLSVQEHLMLACAAHGLNQGLTRGATQGQARIHRLLEAFELRESRDLLPSQLSYGMAKKLSLAMALVHNPKVLILDEPFEGLDPAFVKHTRDLLAALARKGLTVFLTSHSLDLMERLVDRFAILAGGGIACEGDLADLRASGTSLEELFLRHVPTPASQDLEWIG